MNRGLARAFRLFGALLLVHIVHAAPAPAASIVVDTLADVADPPFDVDNFCGGGTVADLPGADGHVSLREAIGAANHSGGPHRISFAPALAGGTLSVSFDDLDTDSLPDPLPFLCGGNITLDGDTDGDNVPDIAVSGNAALPSFAAGINVYSSDNTVKSLRVQGFPAVGILVYHPFFQSAETPATNNSITDNIVQGGTYPIVVEASFDAPTQPGSVSNTTVTGNTVSDSSQSGILIFTGDGAGSSIDATTISSNQVMNNAGYGILITTNLTAAGTGSRITQTAVRDNEVSGNGATGIAAFSFKGHDCAITDTVIDHNIVHDNGFGISGIAGACGATRNRLEITISRNTLANSGIFTSGGTNIQCGPDPLPAATENMATATISGNLLTDSSGPGISMTGGTVNAVGNSLTATVTGNDVVGLIGMTIAGGLGISGDDIGPADNNTLAATVRDNHIGRGFAGIGITGGASGVARNNHVQVVVERNAACGNPIADIQCEGGFAGALGVAANQGTGNVVTGSIASNLATRIVVDNGVIGNTSNVVQQYNAPCHAGDASCNGRVTAADITALVALIADDDRATCELDDANGDGTINAKDVPATIKAIFS